MREKLDLPFNGRRRGGAERVYDHRAGIFSVLILAVALAAAFIGARIVIRTKVPTDAILVDIRTAEELREEARRLQQQVRLRQSSADAGYIRNAASNAAGELRDDRSTNTSAIREQLDAATSGMNANREAWERGQQEIDAMESPQKGKGESSAPAARVSGRVLVEYSLVAPLRSGEDIITPGYRCEREGMVVVNIEVSRAGNVTKASVAAGSAADECMHQTALDAARRSRFNIDRSAPERHAGTITYRFVAQ